MHSVSYKGCFEIILDKINTDTHHMMSMLLMTETHCGSVNFSTKEEVGGMNQ